MEHVIIVLLLFIIIAILITITIGLHNKLDMIFEELMIVRENK